MAINQFLCQLIVLAFLLSQVNVEAKSLLQQRILNGLSAKPKQFPYQVYLELFENGFRVNYCSGVIISERIILTAAHCVAMPFDWIQIYFGAVDKRNIREMGQQRFIVYPPSVQVHEHFHISQCLNDIALIKLPIELHFSEYIQAVELPSKNETYDNQTALLVSGWGQKHDYNGNLVESNLLKYYVGNRLANGECSNIIHRYKPAFLFPTSLLCLEPSYSVSCFGDAGGPLVLNGTNVLIGLRTVGLQKECIASIPDLYTRVSAYLNWIEKATNNLLNSVENFL